MLIPFFGDKLMELLILCRKSRKKVLSLIKKGSKGRIRWKYNIIKCEKGKFASSVEMQGLLQH